ncbi:VOC family protein [Halobacillus andaensis]|uniref:VOC family protein n=1 Tax=Halobacillus andaensis TaxID=1176239 RepID=A0A917B855_HALAA|nr:VOC family protein [Halobacillus andaensis]MBP2005329.1 PhnB protein [Halobacillus andaensis]GGF30620.1 VOC family protein [Halobacillus andaensis]
MKQHVTPYLTFNGNASAALHFYKDTFGGEITDIQTFDEADFHTPSQMKDRIMHARLQNGPMLLMFSDSFSADGSEASGTQVSLAVELEDEHEIKEIYEKLKVQGTVKMELQDTFWGATFAKVTDKFGITWDLILQK